MSVELLAALTVFTLAILCGFAVISKVPATLHTPLMSGANSIHGNRARRVDVHRGFRD
jgi:NAD(P) transhydrogenase subunit alpha